MAIMIGCRGFRGLLQGRLPLARCFVLKGDIISGYAGPPADLTPRRPLSRLLLQELGADADLVIRRRSRSSLLRRWRRDSFRRSLVVPDDAASSFTDPAGLALAVCQSRLLLILRGG